MADPVVKIYGDGEFWVDGQKKAKLYPDGDIWADGKKIGKLYGDGDIWIDGESVGRVFSNGDLWIGGRKAATGIYLLDLLDNNSNQPVNKNENSAGAAPTFIPAGVVNIKPSFSGVGNFGCGVIFVVVLLIAAFVYACFALWFSELPQILFGNFQSLGNIAMISVYVCMFITMYRHCKKAIHNGRVMFFKGIAMQGVVFLANIVIFTVLDLIVTAISYGIPVGIALGELGGLLGGSLGGVIVSAFFVAAAPTAVSSVISFICIKKGIKIPDSGNKKFSAEQNRFASKQSTAYRRTPAASNTAAAVKKASAATSGGGAWLIWIAASVLSVYLSAVLPIAAVMGFDIIEYIPIGEAIWVPAIAIILSVVIRRKKAKISVFWKHWLIQSLIMTVGNYINLDMLGIADTTGGYFLSVACVTFCVGLLAAWATAPFVRK